MTGCLSLRLTLHRVSSLKTKMFSSHELSGETTMATRNCDFQLTVLAITVQEAPVVENSPSCDQVDAVSTSQHCPCYNLLS